MVRETVLQNHQQEGLALTETPGWRVFCRGSCEWDLSPFAGGDGSARVSVGFMPV